MLNRFNQRSAEPHEQQTQHETEPHVKPEPEPLLVLQKQVHVVGKRRKGGEAAAESRDEEHVHRRRNQVRLLGHPEEDADDEAADQVDREGSPRKGFGPREVEDFSSQKTQAGADEAS